MVATTTRLALPKPQLTDNVRDYSVGTIAGGGLHQALDLLDQALLQTLFNAKGDLLAASAADTLSLLSVGANGTILVADSAAAAGMAWSTLPWTSFTPTLSQSGAVTNTVTKANYLKIGTKTVIAHIDLAVTGAGGGATAIQIGSIPAAIAPATSGAVTSDLAMVGSVYDVSANILYAGLAVFLNATTLQIIVSGNGNWVGAAPALTLANGDRVGLQLLYELA